MELIKAIYVGISLLLLHITRPFDALRIHKTYSMLLTSISMNIWHRFPPTDILWKTKLWTSYSITYLKKQSLICASLISLQSASNHILLRLKNWLQLLCWSLQLVLINKKMPPSDLILHQNLILVELHSKSVVLIIRH